MKRELVYEDLTYKINGILFEVHNELGRYRNEEQYGDLIEKRLRERPIQYEREKVLPASFDGERKGRNKIDFVVDDKVILEVKAKAFLEKSDYFQLMRYLDSCDKRLGILVNFRQKHLTPKRVIRGY